VIGAVHVFLPEVLKRCQVFLAGSPEPSGTVALGKLVVEVLSVLGVVRIILLVLACYQPRIVLDNLSDLLSKCLMLCNGPENVDIAGICREEHAAVLHRQPETSFSCCWLATGTQLKASLRRSQSYMTGSGRYRDPGGLTNP
jgi:hypothetical protein